MTPTHDRPAADPVGHPSRSATRTVVRFHDEVDGPPPDGFRGLALALPGLPAPRFAAVDVGATGEGLVVEAEVRRGRPPAPAVGFAMMSVARRDPGLTRARFVERWRGEAGRLGGEVVPDDVRGRAYVQLHPVDPDPPYDAINVVWFDDDAGLRRRAAWFAARPVPDLFVDAWALYLRVASNA